MGSSMKKPQPIIKVDTQIQLNNVLTAEKIQPNQKVQANQLPQQNYNSFKVQNKIVLPQVKPPVRRQKTDIKLKKVRESKQNDKGQSQVQQIKIEQKNWDSLTNQSKTTPLIPLHQVEVNSSLNSEQRSKRYRVSRMI